MVNECSNNLTSSHRDFSPHSDEQSSCGESRIAREVQQITVPARLLFMLQSKAASTLKDSSCMAGSCALVPLRLRQPLVRTCRLAAAHKKMSTSSQAQSSSSASNSTAPPAGQAGEDAKPPLVMQLILDRALIVRPECLRLSFLSRSELTASFSCTRITPTGRQAR